MRRIRGVPSVGVGSPIVNPPVVTQGSSIGAPTWGWDAVNPIANMPPDHAISLVNWFPQQNSIRLRRGFTQWSDTGTGLPVETVMSYEGISESAGKFFAASDDTIFNITSGTAIADVTGQSNARWQYVNYATTGGNFLWVCNGEDVPQYYDGSAWAETVITGVTPEDIIHVNIHQNRMWFTLKDSTKAAYLPVDSIQGAAITFELGGLWNLGGYLMAMGTWTIYSNNGPEDYAAFISSMGQVAVYRGTDPADVATWSLVGVFDMGPPIGRRCYTKIGSDLAIISLDGVVPMSKALVFDRGTVQSVSLTNRIQSAMNDSARSYAANFGWQLIGYPRGTMAILNVPIAETTMQQQYVMNTITGAWCQFTGQNANCWELFHNRPFFGGNDGIVYEADTSGVDDDEAIMAEMETAFNYYGTRGRLKRWHMARPLLTTDGQVEPGMGLNVDFRTDAIITAPQTIIPPVALWDQAIWDQAIWPLESFVETSWRTVTGIGYCASIKMAVNVYTPADDDVVLEVNGFDVLYENGAFI